MTSRIFVCFLYLICMGVLVVMTSGDTSAEQDIEVEVAADETEEYITFSPPSSQNTNEEDSDDDFDPSIDPYPEHEPIMQPFEETYEEDQAAEKKRLEEKAKRKSSQTGNSDKTKEEFFLNPIEDSYEEEFTAPAIQLDGMADHEPVYQPEDPGDDINYPFHNERPDKEPEASDEEDNKNLNDEILTYGDDDDDSFDKVLTDDEVYDAEDNHEPVYQPGDPGDSGHDEL